MTGTTDGSRGIVFDITMHDGEQSPGASAKLDESLRIVTVLTEETDVPATATTGLRHEVRNDVF